MKSVRIVFYLAPKVDGTADSEAIESSPLQYGHDAQERVFTANLQRFSVFLRFAESPLTQRGLSGLKDPKVDLEPIQRESVKSGRRLVNKHWCPAFNSVRGGLKMASRSNQAVVFGSHDEATDVHFRESCPFAIAKDVTSSGRRRMSEELQRLRNEGEPALAELFSGYRERLEQMVDFRLDSRLRGRVDPADVVQEAYFRVSKRLTGFLDDPSVSLFVWLRSQTYQALIEVQRRHSWKKRDPRQEVSMRRRSTADGTSYAIAEAMCAQLTSPSQAAVRAEELQQLRSALASMDKVDREVLALRHFEHLSNNEVAESLQISATAASNRYVRAMTRLGQLMTRLMEVDA